MLFMADRAAYPKARYYQDAAIRATFEKILRSEKSGTPSAGAVRRDAKSANNLGHQQHWSHRPEVARQYERRRNLDACGGRLRPRHPERN
jgi:hypothetical protein